MLYRNLGAPWRSSTGEVVPRGGTFTPTPRDLGRIERRRLLGIRFVPVAAATEDARVSTATPLPVRANDGPESVEEMTEQSEQEPLEQEPSESQPPPALTPASSRRVPAWTMKMAPELYLKLHPTGPHADLAKAHVAAQGGGNGLHK